MTFKNAWGYQGNAMALPVADVDEAVPFYTDVLGFEIVSRNDTPHRSILLSRPNVQMQINENGGDASQDGCAFEVTDVEAVLNEFKNNGLAKELSDISIEKNDSGTWRVFYIIAPDGLCYWIGEKQPA
ncbi:MAG: VOC family protein [Pyrinomonadaceae bacterium]